jgi:hypothetical protein
MHATDVVGQSPLPEHPTTYLHPGAMNASASKTEVKPGRNRGGFEATWHSYIVGPGVASIRTSYQRFRLGVDIRSQLRTRNATPLRRGFASPITNHLSPFPLTPPLIRYFPLHLTGLGVCKNRTGQEWFAHNALWKESRYCLRMPLR